jgi:hypothetical protein
VDRDRGDVSRADDLERWPTGGEKVAPTLQVDVDR